MKRILIVAGLVGVSALMACGGSSSDRGDYEYVAIGASATAGIGASPLRNGYVYRIDNALDDCRGGGVDLTNLGIPSAETPEIQDVEVPAAVAKDPDLITIWAGPNDIIGGRSVEDFEMRLVDILQTLREETAAEIVIADMPDLTQVPRFQLAPDPNVTADRIAAYNEAIGRQAAAFGVHLVGLQGIEVSENFVSEIDQFHPSNAGHSTLAEEFLSTVRPIACP